jgi:hypothetical protein
MIKQYPLKKIAIFVILLSIIIVLCNISFWLINKTDILYFLSGIILLTLSVGIPIELLIRYLNKTKK